MGYCTAKLEFAPFDPPMIDDLEDTQAERCVALQARPDLVRSATLFPWWPRRVRKRQGPRTS